MLVTLALLAAAPQSNVSSARALVEFRRGSDSLELESTAASRDTRVVTFRCARAGRPLAAGMLVTGPVTRDTRLRGCKGWKISAEWSATFAGRPAALKPICDWRRFARFDGQYANHSEDGTTASRATVLMTRTGYVLALSAVGGALMEERIELESPRASDGKTQHWELSFEPSGNADDGMSLWMSFPGDPPEHAVRLDREMPITSSCVE